MLNLWCPTTVPTWTCAAQQGVLPLSCFLQSLSCFLFPAGPALVGQSASDQQHGSDTEVITFPPLPEKPTGGCQTSSWLFREVEKLSKALQDDRNTQALTNEEAQRL